MFHDAHYVTIDRHSLAVVSSKPFDRARFGFATFVPHVFVRIVNTPGELTQTTTMEAAATTTTTMPVGTPQTSTSHATGFSTATTTGGKEKNTLTKFNCVFNADSPSLFDTTNNEAINTGLITVDRVFVNQVDLENGVSLELIVGIAAGACCVLVAVIVVVVFVLRRKPSGAVDGDSTTADHSSSMVSDSHCECNFKLPSKATWPIYQTKLQQMSALDQRFPDSNAAQSDNPAQCNFSFGFFCLTDNGGFRWRHIIFSVGIDHHMETKRNK